MTTVRQKILAGFMARNEVFAQAAGLVSVEDPREKARFWSNFRVAKATLSTIAPLPEAPPVLTPLPATATPYLERLSSTEWFQESFGGLDCGFYQVPLDRVHPIQTFCNLEPAQPAPSETELSATLSYAFPIDSVVPADIVPTPTGFRFTASRYGLGLNHVRRRIKEGQVVLSLEHPNLLLIRKLGNTLILCNGTHRCVESATAGLTHVPALVIEHQNPNEMELPQGPGFWNTQFLLGPDRQPGWGVRPPTIPDFLSPLAIETRVPLTPSIIDVPVGSAQQGAMALPQGIAFQIGGVPGR